MPKKTISKLIAVLDAQELADASERLEGGHGLRVVTPFRAAMKEAAN
jgi:hypothetical protein